MDAATTHTALKLERRIGSTLYTINVYSSQTTKEMMHDKILRLIEHDYENSCLKNPQRCDTMKLLQTVRSSGCSV